MKFNKRQIIKIIFLIVLISSVAMLLWSMRPVQKTISFSNAGVQVEPELNQNTSTVSKNSESMQNISETLKNEKREFEDFSDLRRKFPDGARLLSLKDSDLPAAAKEALQKKFDNLHQYGNLSADKVTNEFQNLDKFRGMLGKNEKLAFQPLDAQYFVPSDLKFTGKYYSGIHDESDGYNSYYRLYEGSDGRKIEVNEMYLNPKNNTVVDVFSESLNKTISEKPMTWQAVPTENGTLYSADFIQDGKMFSVSSMSLSESEMQNVVSNIIKNAN